MIATPPQLVGYSQDLARYRGESAAPDLWPDIAWMPMIGATGDRLPDLSGNGHDGTNNGAAWVTSPVGYALDCNGAKYVSAAGAGKVVPGRLAP